MQSNAELEINLIDINNQELMTLRKFISQAWQKIAPCWPIKHLIAVNPLQGLEDLPFEEALMEGYAYFQDVDISDKMLDINRETIKWCQAFFDEGQAEIKMPLRHLGLYQSFRQLSIFDKNLHQSNVEHKKFLTSLPHSAEETIAECLNKLKIPFEKRALFLSLLLTKLPGWASYIKYRIDWAQVNNNYHSVSKADYLAMRLVLTSIFWPEAVDLLKSYNPCNKDFLWKKINEIKKMEDGYQKILLDSLSRHAAKIAPRNQQKTIAQLIFCIDVRSEPFRRALEAQGDYETFGFAGFFGIPVRVENDILDESKVSCPVLLQPKHTVKEVLNFSKEDCCNVLNHIVLINRMKRIYQSLKYTFTTPLILVEIMGFWSGLWMLLRTFCPIQTIKFKQKIFESSELKLPLIPLLIEDDEKNGIGFSDQCDYAESALRMIGLVDYFAPLIVLCGHGSSTQNNPYATALDCGACGGNRGASNARILATILNDIRVREYLANRGISIPHKTKFIAAEHNTTTDEVLLYSLNIADITVLKKLDQLRLDMQAARKINNKFRCQQLGYVGNKKNVAGYITQLKKRSANWAETRPEWGLARNAAFIVGPRNLTKSIDLEGRAFLHSYNWEEDQEGTSLTTILTAPMIVAQWINNQYLFSLLDNVTYGSGSKITHNITGKLGIMQGNGSDLMHGLPLQSLYSSDTKAYHEPLRLITIVYAPQVMITAIISAQPILQKLFGNGWLTIACIDPTEGNIYYLQRDLSWEKIDKRINDDIRTNEDTSGMV
jgi:uncharacterized protein YbcC (UPF0753/DUF2309 family)